MLNMSFCETGERLCLCFQVKRQKRARPEKVGTSVQFDSSAQVGGARR